MVEPGIFVPINAIFQEAGQTSVFMLQDDSTVQKVRVQRLTVDDLSQGSLAQIKPIDSEAFPSNAKIVVGGVHYLQDGEQVNVIETVNELDN